MNALLISYTVVSFLVFSAVMAMLLWAAVEDGKAERTRRATVSVRRDPLPHKVPSSDKRA
jgi:hypothetical protein